MLQVGHDLIKADNFGSEKIQNRIDNIEEQWRNLLELANFRRRRLMEAVDFYQVSAVLKFTYLCIWFICASVVLNRSAVSYTHSTNDITLIVIF